LPPSPLVLSFDTSAAHCAAALLCDDKILAQNVEYMAKGQAERLFGLLQGLLSQAGVSWHDLTCVGVGIGPGNFTGIRISVSAARGLALSLNIPAIGVSSLEAQAKNTKGTVLSVLDARMGHYYMQGFDNSGQIDVIKYEPVHCMLETTPVLRSRDEIAVIGHDADIVAAQVSGTVSEPALPLAVAIGQIAVHRIQDAARRPSPLYLRFPDAAPARDTAPKILP